MGNNTIKTIGILTSGGDAPGMNAAIRAVVRTAIANDMRVIGILRGYNGLLNNDFVELDLRKVSGILHRGGTILYTARCLEFKEEKGVEKGKENCINAGIDGIVVIGGDGSFRGARDLSLRGIPCVGIPGTIDNDIASSDYTIGFNTALSTVMENVDRLRDTSQSHDRCSLVEVMGNRCGDIALHSGIACGAVSILVPELEVDIDRDIINRMRRTLGTGKKHFIVVVAEGIINGKVPVRNGQSMTIEEMAQYIQSQTDVETKPTVLGHIQRGGAPTPYDRIVASRMGNYAAQLLKDGIGNRVVVMKKDEIVDYDILEALAMKKSFDMDLMRISQEVSI